LCYILFSISDFNEINTITFYDKNVVSITLGIIQIKCKENERLLINLRNFRGRRNKVG